MRPGLPLTVGLLLGAVAGFVYGFTLAAGRAPWVEAPAEGPPPPPPPPARGEITGPGPHEGYVLVVDPSRLYFEVVHNEHWGIASAYLFDPLMTPLDAKTPPILNMMLDGESHSIEASRENWDGHEDGGWHFEHDALLGAPEYGRWRIVLSGMIYLPVFQHVHLDDGHEAGHGHEADVAETPTD